MSHNNGLREAPGNKEKISKWKLYKNQIKLLKESTKADAPSSKCEGAVLLERVSGIDITLSTSSDDIFQDVQPQSVTQTNKEEKKSGSTSTDIYYPPSQEKSKWSALRNTMHFIRAARPRSRSQSFPAEASQVDSLPPSFSHLYRGQNKASSQPFQLGIATQEEIYEIMGEEVNLYLSGVNRRLSLRQTPSLKDHYEYAGT